MRLRKGISLMTFGSAWQDSVVRLVSRGQSSLLQWCQCTGGCRVSCFPRSLSLADVWFGELNGHMRPLRHLCTQGSRPQAPWNCCRLRTASQELWLWSPSDPLVDGLLLSLSHLCPLARPWTTGALKARRARLKIGMTASERARCLLRALQASAPRSATGLDAMLERLLRTLEGDARQPDAGCQLRARDTPTDE